MHKLFDNHSVTIKSPLNLAKLTLLSIAVFATNTLSMAPAESAKYSSLALCEKYEFNSFWQNANSRKHAQNNAFSNCVKVGTVKLKLSRTEATSCCNNLRTINQGCLAVARGQNSTNISYYYVSKSNRIRAVTSAIKSCNRDFFECQVKTVTCVGRK